MAYYNSGPLDPNYDGFTLGVYEISIRVTPDPGESTTGINVRCYNSKTGEIARVSAEVEGTVESWCVEANEDTADVYVTYKIDALDTSPIQQPVSCAASGTLTTPIQTQTYDFSAGSGKYTTYAISKLRVGHLWASSESGAVGRITFTGETYPTTTQPLTSMYKHGGKTVYYGWIPSGAGLAGGEWTSISPVCNNGQFVSVNASSAAATAWTMIYGESVVGTYEFLVARFAIDLHDAGGTGPDSEWEDPGDEDEDGKPGDPPKVLNLYVWGALSGRHNDPLHDTSYSYLPTTNDAEANWGNGGNGGHGGGGGAGASTIVIGDFVTDKADSKFIFALTARHGYGSGGGAGAKGGDGCILIFY